MSNRVKAILAEIKKQSSDFVSKHNIAPNAVIMDASDFSCLIQYAKQELQIESSIRESHIDGLRIVTTYDCRIMVVLE